MTIGMCLKSIFMPHQNEFIFIWLYLAFAITLWVYFGLLVARDEEVYGFKNEEYYMWMFIATLAVAVSVTVTLIYLTFYSISPWANKALDKLDWSFKIIAIYSLLIVFLAAELSPNQIKVNEQLNFMQLAILVTVTVFLAVIILVQFDSTKSAGWWLTFTFLVIVFLIDLIYASQQQMKNFYLVMIILVVLYTVLGIFSFF